MSGSNVMKINMRLAMVKHHIHVQVTHPEEAALATLTADPICDKSTSNLATMQLS